jgi:hypothetical protein
LARKGRNEFIIAIALDHFAVVMALDGEQVGAARLWGYVEARYNALGYTRGPSEKRGHGRLMAALRVKLDDHEIEKLAAEGAAWSEDRAVEEVLN